MSMILDAITQLSTAIRMEGGNPEDCSVHLPRTLGMELLRKHLAVGLMVGFGESVHIYDGIRFIIEPDPVEEHWHMGVCYYTRRK